MKLEDYRFEKIANENAFVKLIHINDSVCVKMKIGVGHSLGIFPKESGHSLGRSVWCELWLVDPISPIESGIWIGNPDGTCIESDEDNLDELFRKADEQVRSFTLSLSRKFTDSIEVR